ncbi:hypothetical protein DDI_1682 [Dickeya dianthicola RNS04.9]|nr:hypothetical protein DDI_1682 [Dickeya dianthicola RNS04.9]
MASPPITPAFMPAFFMHKIHFAQPDRRFKSALFLFDYLKLAFISLSTCTLK